MASPLSSNIIIILFAVVVVIIRAVTQVRKKPEKKPPQVRIPVSFEDEKEPEMAVRSTMAVPPAVKAARPKQPLGSRATLSPLTAKTAFDSGDTAFHKGPAVSKGETGAAVGSKTVPVRSAGAVGVSPAQRDFILKLNHLSPMKQAVVMAEVLGPPKGML